MSALYQMRYNGVGGTGHGAIYIGNGKLLGVDITGARYHGSYTEAGGSVNGNCTLTSAGAALVTGQQVPAGTQVPISFSVSSNWTNGQFVTVNVAGRPVQVAFDKIGDIP